MQYSYPCTILSFKILHDHEKNLTLNRTPFLIKLLHLWFDLDKFWYVGTYWHPKWLSFGLKIKDVFQNCRFFLWTSNENIYWNCWVIIDSTSSDLVISQLAKFNGRENFNHLINKETWRHVVTGVDQTHDSIGVWLVDNCCKTTTTTEPQISVDNTLFILNLDPKTRNLNIVRRCWLFTKTTTLYSYSFHPILIKLGIYDH